MSFWAAENFTQISIAYLKVLQVNKGQDITINGQRFNRTAIITRTKRNCHLTIKLFALGRLRTVPFKKM